MLGFVDGTANPAGPDVRTTALIGDEDPDFRGDSTVQGYAHDLEAWPALSVDERRDVVGRRQLDDVELTDAAPGVRKSHKTLTTITDKDGDELDTPPRQHAFRVAGLGRVRHLFIGNAARPWVLLRMLEHMSIGDPRGSTTGSSTSPPPSPAPASSPRRPTVLAGLADPAPGPAPPSPRAPTPSDPRAVGPPRRRLPEHRRPWSR